MTRQAAAPIADAEEGLLLGDVLARVAHELELIRVTAMRLEQSLCNAADGWGIDDERVRDLQQLDKLTQHAAALRDFLAAIATNRSEPATLASALARITLEDVRARLAQDDEGAAPGGGVEFF